MITWTKPRDELLEKWKAAFRWSNGKSELTLAQMDTRHCFNVCKMCWNHLATVHNLVVIPPFTAYDQYIQIAKEFPDILVRTIIVLISTIETRGDLTPRHEMAYRYLLVQWNALEQAPAAQAPVTPSKQDSPTGRAINLTETV